MPGFQDPFPGDPQRAWQRLANPVRIAVALGSRIHVSPTIGIATSRHPEFTRAMEVLVQWKNAADLPSSILLVRPDHFDRRITLQRSFFTFHVPNEPILLTTASKGLRSFKVDGRTKKAILKELSSLGIDPFSVYGDLEHLARYLTNAYT
jgi:hypothetical protein